MLQAQIQASNLDNLQGQHAPYRISVACSLADIIALEADWRDLEASAQNPVALFQSYDWVVRWCQSQFEGSAPGKYNDCAPFVVAVWADGKLISVWPMQSAVTAKVRTLTWLSMPALQYGDALIDANCNAEEICATAWAFIVSANGADLLKLDNVPSNSPIYRFLSERCCMVSPSKSSILKTGAFADWQAYQASLKKTARRARRKRYNKLARAGALSFSVHRDAEKFAELADIALNWKRQWLEQQHWPGGLINDPVFKRFVKANGDAKCFRARWVAAELSLEGAPVAIELGAVYNNRYYSFLGAYDLDYAKFSPGKIEMEAMIAWVMEQGIDEFDFLCVESQYKSDWTDTSLPVSSFTHPCSIRGQLMHSIWVKRLRPAIKKGLHHIPVSQRKMLMRLVEKRPEKQYPYKP